MIDVCLADLVWFLSHHVTNPVTEDKAERCKAYSFRRGLECKTTVPRNKRKNPWTLSGGSSCRQYGAYRLRSPIPFSFVSRKNAFFFSISFSAFVQTNTTHCIGFTTTLSSVWRYHGNGNWSPFCQSERVTFRMAVFIANHRLQAFPSPCSICVPSWRLPWPDSRMWSCGSPHLLDRYPSVKTPLFFLPVVVVSMQLTKHNAMCTRIWFINTNTFSYLHRWFINRSRTSCRHGCYSIGVKTNISNL